MKNKNLEVITGLFKVSKNTIRSFRDCQNVLKIKVGCKGQVLQTFAGKNRYKAAEKAGYRLIKGLSS